MHIKHLLNTILYLLVIVLVFGVLLYGLNFITGPVIESNNHSAEHEHAAAEYRHTDARVSLCTSNEGGSLL